MENEVDISPKIKYWIIIGGVALVTFILVFFVTNMLVNGNKKKKEEEVPVVDIEKYDAFTAGEAVTLKDNSSWHVLYDSKDNVEYISLLSDKDVNDSNVLYDNLNSFLKGTYKNNLVKSLGCQSSDIQEVRLFAYLDLASITEANSSEFLPDTELSKFNVPSYIANESTVTDTVYQTDTANTPVMICKGEESDGADNNSLDVTGKFCLGDASTSLPVRPVLVISKKYVNKVKGTGTDITITNNNSTDSNSSDDKTN